MAKIIVNNPRQVINGGAKKYYFKVKGLGGPKGDKGDKGDTGSQGPQGPQGNAATVSVGSTTTLPVGYDATVENVGTQYNAVLNFGIPQGPRGPQGIQGERGEPGQTGQTGPRGPQGERGTNATVYVGTTTTTNPGTQARVYNSGTDSNAVLNFEIPRGDVGPQPELVQTTGTSTTKAMSQNATTEALATKQNTINSSNKLSADLVTDTSTTNKFVTAEDKTNWNAKQDALTAGNNIDITDGAISTPAIAPEVVAELPTTGDEGKLYLTPKAHTTQTATGNPIEATVTAQAGKIESFQLDGDTYQQTYTGRNILPNTLQTQTINGVTFTRNADGSITIKGTATARTEPKLWQSSDGGSLIFSSGKNYFNTTSRAIYYFANGYYTIPPNLASGAMPSDRNCSYAYIRVESGESIDTTIYPQIVEGNTTEDYEPYVGGTASPNPDYPQAVNTVTGRQVVKVEGKNLYDATKAETTLDGITYSGDNEALYLDGSIAHNQGIDWGNVALSAGTYTLTLELVSGSFTSTATGALFYVYGDNISMSPQNPNLVPSSPKLSIAVTVSADTTNAHITSWTRNTEHFNNAVIKYQLVKGETADYDFEPNKVEDYEINLGKNLINIPYMETEWLGARVIENGSTVTMRPGSNGDMNMSYYSPAAPVAIPAGETITWSRTWLGGGTWTSGAFTFPLELTYSDGTTESITMGDTTKSNYLNVLSKTKTLEKDVVSVMVMNALCYGVKGLSEETAFGLQLELGSTATSYAPYFTPIELCKLGDYQDYIYKDGDSWKVHKATNKITVDGSENWVYPDSGANYTFFQFSRDNFITKYGNAADFYASITEVGFAKADKFEQIVASSANMRTEQGIGFTTEGKGWFRISVANTIATTVNVFKTWLADHPTTAYYALAIATDTTITDSNLIAQLEAIRTASLQNGTNTITNTAAGSNLAGDMEIGYYGFAPRNRYDKWLWLDINNEYEQIGS